MTTLPTATTTVSATTGAPGSGDQLVTVIGCVPINADATPRLYGNAGAIYDQHGYSEALEYAALHIAETRLPVLFVGIPIEVEGAVGRVDVSGNSGTSVASVTAASGGVLAEHDGVVRVVRGGTVGTDQILLELSLDGGRSYRRVRLGTGTSYALPFVGATLAFAGGDLVAGDTVITWHGTAPQWGSDGLAAARSALAGTQYASRSWIVIGDCPDGTAAAAIVTQVNAYRTSNQRFVYARASVPDRLPVAALGATQSRSVVTATFAEAGATGDTITRAGGSWITDGFVTGDLIDVTGADESGNNIESVSTVTVTSAEVLTLDTDDLVDEVATAGVTVVGHESLTFAAVTANTITRNRGSFLDDGFRTGDLVTITGCVEGGNNVTAEAITTLTAHVMTLGGATLADEIIRARDVSLSAGQTKAAWVASTEVAFAAIDSEERIDLALGRARKASPFSGWLARRSAAWAASVREYQHDLHVATWRKSDGPLSGWDLYDADGTLVEFDEAVDGGALAGRFTCLRSWSNGPRGAHVALSLTRADEDDPRAYTHNAAVVNAACTIVQATTENFIGYSPTVDSEGHMTRDELQILKGQVDRALQLSLLQDQRGEGARASNAYWTPNSDDVLNVPGATLTGVATLNLRGTIVNVNTVVRVN